MAAPPPRRGPGRRRAALAATVASLFATLTTAVLFAGPVHAETLEPDPGASETTAPSPTPEETTPPPDPSPTETVPTFVPVYGVNVKAPFFLTQALVPAMIEAGGGVVINLGSWIARLAVPVGALYSSTKGAMETLTRAWAAEFGSQGVRVNAISPGVVVSPDWDTATDHPGEVMMHGTPFGRSGHPDAIAAAAVYLASDDSAFVHGTVLDVDGGRTGVAVIARG